MCSCQRGDHVLFYRPVQDQRFFSAGRKYDSINWNDFKEIVRAFQIRIEDWYIKPAEELRKASWDYSFSIMAIDCLLIDALSQFHYGQFRSSRTLFCKYARKKISGMRKRLPEPIAIRPERRANRKSPKSSRKPAKTKYLKTYADSLYFAFRCGVLHEAHIAGCGGLAGLGGKLADIDPDICTRYRDGSECPTIRMDPTAILDDLQRVFNQYISDILDPDPTFEPRRRKFKRKFTACIGIDITNAK